MSVEGLEMLRKHMAYYDFAPDRVLLLGNVLYYAKKAEVEVAELEAENAKLRELVRQSIYAMDDADWASIVSAAIGLGVEVDG